MIIERWGERSCWMTCDKYKFAFPNIAKNGVTTLKRLVLLYDLNMNVTDTVDIHTTFDRMLAAHRMQYDEIPEEYTKFAVYRDPIERFLSYCKNKHTSVNDAIDTISGRCYDGTDICKDQHLRRQTDYYDMSEPDIIVPIGVLPSFLHKHFNIPKQDIQIVNKSRSVYDPVLLEDNRKFLMEYYKKDFNIMKSNKIWTC